MGDFILSNDKRDNNHTSQSINTNTLNISGNPLIQTISGTGTFGTAFNPGLNFNWSLYKIGKQVTLVIYRWTGPVTVAFQTLIDSNIFIPDGYRPKVTGYGYPYFTAAGLNSGAGELFWVNIAETGNVQILANNLATPSIFDSPAGSLADWYFTYLTD